MKFIGYLLGSVLGFIIINLVFLVFGISISEIQFNTLWITCLIVGIASILLNEKDD